MGVKQKEQTEGKNDILNYPPTTPHNPNHKPPAFCVLLSHNSLLTNSRPRYAWPLGVEDIEQQTEGSDDNVNFHPSAHLT